MTQEDKELLLKDLSARLPYSVVVAHRLNVDNVYGVMSDIDMFGNVYIQHYGINKIKDVKPYLRLMSSMTKEEEKEYAKVIVKSQDCSLENSESATTIVNDWYLSKGFDVRGLIPKGLALEAPEGMYND